MGTQLRTIFFIIFFVMSANILTFGSYIKLLPKPQNIEIANGRFNIDKVSVNTTCKIKELESFITRNGGTITNNSSKSISVSLKENLPFVPQGKEEAYLLTVNSNNIKIEAVTETGVYRAIQTLEQLVEINGKKSNIKNCRIQDWAAFPIRGFMHDVGRGYISIDELKREIELLSRFKINVFHWHLTEYHAWRLESKLFPMLNDSINMTRLHGKYYTMEEAKDLIQFCKERHVLVIPEIDMPGHSDAFIRTFRHDMQSPEGMIILKLLIDEICENLDVPYLHIGTDEVKFTNKDFVPEMVAYIRSKNKKTISWNPGWNYKKGEIDMTQLWSYRGKPTAGIPAIDSRYHYLNHYDTFADIIGLYNSSIYGHKTGSDSIVGAIISIWNDRAIETEESIVMANHIYPNMLALAERTWSGGGNEYFNKYGTMLADEGTIEYDEFINFEERILHYKDKWFSTLPFPYVKQTNIKWHITDAFPNNGELHKVFPPENEIKDTYIYESSEYKTHFVTGGGVYLRHPWGEKILPGLYKEPKENHTSYAYTYVYSPKDQIVGLLAEFQNYSRSEKDIPPRQGTWDYKGSKIWINDSEIAPPIWSSTHTTKSNEIPLGNENCVSRPPLEVKLNKGWNKVLLKLPVGKFRTEEVRLVKWMFTSVFVTLDGKNAVEGLTFSPTK